MSVCIFRFSICFVALLYNYHLVLAFKRIHSHSLPSSLTRSPRHIHKLIYKYIYSLATSRLRFKCSRKAIVFICTVLLSLAVPAFLWHAIHFWLWLLSLCLVYFALVRNKLFHLLGTFFSLIMYFQTHHTIKRVHTITSYFRHSISYMHRHNTHHTVACARCCICVYVHIRILFDRCLFFHFHAV